jgi:hypothetical protein
MKSVLIYLYELDRKSRYKELENKIFSVIEEAQEEKPKRPKHQIIRM